MQNYYKEIYQSIDRYGYRTLDDAYKRPSAAKKAAYQHCKDIIADATKNATFVDMTITAANAFTFTVMFRYIQHNTLWVGKITKNKITYQEVKTKMNELIKQLKHYKRKHQLDDILANSRKVIADYKALKARRKDPDYIDNFFTIETAIDNMTDLAVTAHNITVLCEEGYI